MKRSYASTCTTSVAAAKIANDVTGAKKIAIDTSGHSVANIPTIPIYCIENNRPYADMDKDQIEAINDITCDGDYAQVLFKRQANQERKKAAAADVKKFVRRAPPSTNVSDSTTGVPTQTGFNMETLPEHHFHLGDDIFAVVSEFRYCVKVHLRRYSWDGYAFHPTKIGIVLTPILFETFSQKVKSFNHESDGEVLVILKELFVSTKCDSENGIVINIQRMFQKKDGSLQFFPTVLTFKSTHFEQLKEACAKISESVRSVLFGELLHKEVLKTVRSLNRSQGSKVNNYKEVVSLLKNSLMTILKVAMEKNICELFVCSGCEMNLGNQLGHECLTYSHQARVDLYSAKALAKVDVKDIANQFVNDNVNFVNIITYKFLKGIDTENLIEMVKDMYVKEDPSPTHLYFQ